MAGLNAKLQILSVETREGTSKKSGAAYKMVVAQCAVHDEDGTLKVGELVVPKELPQDIKPGFYDAVFKVGVSMDKKVGGLLVGLKAIAAPKPAAA
jgi:hypothetical protein